MKHSGSQPTSRPEATPGQKLGRCGRLLLAALLLLPPNLWAATITVDGTTCSLVDAVTAANTDSAAGGCPAGSGADTLDLQTDVTLTAAASGPAGGYNGLPRVTSDITVLGNGYTIARAGNAPPFRICQVNPSGSLSLQDVTLRGGREGTGGALRNLGSLTLANTTVSGNVALGKGGGIYQAIGSTTLQQGSLVTNNGAFTGGGVFVLAGTATLIDSTVSDNSAPKRVNGSEGDGGGLYLQGGTAALTNTTVSGNFAEDGGGGLYVRPFATADLTNSTVSTNYAYRGGGIFSLRLGSANLVNSTISTNTGYFGASIFAWDDGGSGGLQGDGSKLAGVAGLSAAAGLTSTGVTLVNSLIGNRTGSLDNCEGNIPGAVVDSGNNLDDDGSCVGGAGGGALYGLDATLDDNGGPTRTHALECGSSAIDAAGDCVGEFGLTTDQRGEPRPAGLACDSGSYELQNPAAAEGLYPIALHEETLDGVEPGDIIEDIYNGSQPGNFGWLTWAGSPSEPTLVESLTPPGNSEDYVNPYDPADHVISVDDWVQGSPGVSNSRKVRRALDYLIDEEIVITIPIWDDAELQGNNANYQVAGFAQVRLISYRLPRENRISAEFLGTVDLCE